MKRLIQKVLLLLLLGFVCNTALAQRVALRTNLLDWAMLSPNLTLESRLSSRLSLGIGFAANPFKLNIADTRLENFRVQPELRYWFNRPMARHFMGFALLGGLYNFHHKATNRKGDIFAAGFTYGYALVLSRHWNVEFTAGIGLGKTRFFKYNDGEPRPDSPNNSKWIPVPMNVGVSFTYIFK